MTRMKTAVSVLFVGVMALAASESTKAGLIDRGNGLIYDTVLDVTWVQDIALSSTLGGPRIFNWYGAKAWVDQLVYGGYDDWRLPTLTPINGVRFNRRFRCDGSADYGYGVAAPGGASAGFTGNELAHMFHVNLGNKSQCVGDGPDRVRLPDVGIQNASFVDALTGETVSFLNLQGQKRFSWFDLAPPIVDGAEFTWAFKYSGFNDWENAIVQRHRAWAVRDGDVLVTSVPEPSTLLLLSGLLPGLWFSMKRKSVRRQRFAS